jgi:hypothetical protein
VRRSLIDQFGVAVSALARLLLILLALGMVSRPLAPMCRAFSIS